MHFTFVLDYFTEMIEHLIHHGVITGEEPELMAAQLCLPITVWINLCDREPDRESEIMDMVEKHVRQFFKVYQVKGCEKNEKTHKNMTLGMSIGMCFGVAIGCTWGESIFGNTGTGLAMGMCVGMCIGMAVGAAKDKAVNRQLEE